MTTLKDNGSGTYDDYVEGYVDIQYTIATGKTVGDYFGLCKSTSGAAGYDVGYFTVVREPLQENGLGWSKANPMTKLAIQHMRMNRDDINYSSSPTLPDSDPFTVFGAFILTVPGYVVEVAGMIASYNVVQFSLGNCKFIRLDGHSKVRLYDEDGRKYGGGARVRQLSIEDNWAAGSTAVTGEEGIYGQKYVYNMSGIDGDDNSISSGVAYEPFIGAEESALRQPVNYSQSTPLRSAYSLFVEKPVLDFYYPGASVGYRKVTVYSLGKDHATIEAGSTAVNHNAAAPATIYEFYTPKDFPIYSDETDLNPEQTHLVPVIVPGIYTYYEAKKARSQGYSIVLNDMAGKLRKTSQVKVANDNTPTGGLISSVEYVYNTALPFNEEGGNKLSSQVQAIIPTSGLEPQIETAVLGQTVDIHQERHESRYSDIGYGLEGNLDISILTSPPYILLAPSAFPSFSQTETSMKTVTMQKVIHRSGILMKTIAKTDQSVIESENLGFDLFTGEPILTRTNNEYDDKVYTFSYPGHWYYDHLKAVQQNDYLVMNGLSITVGSAGEVVLPTGFSYSVSNFAVGDEVYLTTSGSTGPPPSNHLAHVTKVDIGANKIWLMDKDGYYLNSGVLITQIKLRNSGLKNMQADKVGAISFKKLSGYTTAYLDNTSPSPLSFDEIINASALEYSDYWQSDCSTCTSREGGSGSGDVVNPFLEGIRNQWRPKKTYAYKTKRVYNGNSRTEGYFADYSRFKWENPSTSSASWILGNTITKYSPFGFELENKDALGNFSSAHYGYQNALMVSLASNSRYQENASDNFEDYYAGKDCFGDRMLTCAIPSVDESVISTIITNNDHHTGHYALWPHGSYTDIPFQGKVGSLTGCDDRNDSTQGPALKTIVVEGQSAFEKSDCDCLGGMKLKEGGTYVFSAWTKVSRDWSSTGKPYTYSEPEVAIDFFDSGGTAISGSSVSITPNTRNKIIEGWQRLYKEFQVPSGAASFKVTFKKGTSDAGTNVYYDDMRIHPFDGNMVTYVFDVNNLKLLSELDENNYATFYNYDEEGNLINLKKETIEGIKTISEGRKELQKQ